MGRYTPGRRAVAGLIVSALLGALIPWGPRGNVVLINSQGARIYVQAEVVSSPEEMVRGLMGRTSLEADSGMMFAFGETGTNPFWMKDTLIPLSIAFISQRGVIVDIQDMEPLSQRFHHPTQPYRYALEVNQGFFSRHGIKVGNQVIFLWQGPRPQTSWWLLLRPGKASPADLNSALPSL